jgi:hypothetical protein
VILIIDSPRFRFAITIGHRNTVTRAPDALACLIGMTEREARLWCRRHGYTTSIMRGLNGAEDGRWANGPPRPQDRR